MANNFSDKTNKSIAELAAQIMNNTPATVNKAEPREVIQSDMVDRVLAAGPSGRFKKIQEEVEQVDEVNSRHSFTSAQAALTPKSSDVKAAVGATARDKAKTNKYARRISKITGGEYSKQDVKDNLKSLAKEEVEQIDEVKDKGEYDYEGDMAMSQLKSIIKNAQKLHDMIEEDTNLPEWVQSKITLAEDYIVTVTNYLDNELSEQTSDNGFYHSVNHSKTGDYIGTVTKFPGHHHYTPYLDVRGSDWVGHPKPSVEDAIRELHDMHNQSGYGRHNPSDPDHAIKKYHEEIASGKPHNYMEETAPEGWEGTVKAMKGKRGIDNPWALAWWMRGKGFKSHKGGK